MLTMVPSLKASQECDLIGKDVCMNHRLLLGLWEGCDVSFQGLLAKD